MIVALLAQDWTESDQIILTRNETSMANGHNKDMYKFCEIHEWTHVC